MSPCCDAQTTQLTANKVHKLQDHLGGDDLKSILNRTLELKMEPAYKKLKYVTSHCDFDNEDPNKEELRV